MFLIVLIAAIFGKRLEWAALLNNEDVDEDHDNKITLGQLQKAVLLLTSSEEALTIIKQQHLPVPGPWDKRTSSSLNIWLTAQSTTTITTTIIMGFWLQFPWGS